MYCFLKYVQFLIIRNILGEIESSMTAQSSVNLTSPLDEVDGDIFLDANGNIPPSYNRDMSTGFELAPADSTTETATDHMDIESIETQPREMFTDSVSWTKKS